MGCLRRIGRSISKNRMIAVLHTLQQKSEPIKRHPWNWTVNIWNWTVNRWNRTVNRWNWTEMLNGLCSGRSRVRSDRIPYLGQRRGPHTQTAALTSVGRAEDFVVRELPRRRLCPRRRLLSEPSGCRAAPAAPLAGQRVKKRPSAAGHRRAAPSSIVFGERKCDVNISYSINQSRSGGLCESDPWRL